MTQLSVPGVTDDTSGWSSYSRHFGLPPSGTGGSFLSAQTGANQTAQNSLLQLAGLQGLEKWQWWLIKMTHYIESKIYEKKWIFSLKIDSKCGFLYVSFVLVIQYESYLWRIKCESYFRSKYLLQKYFLFINCSIIEIINVYNQNRFSCGLKRT